jgi:Tol biopolymer transport system component
VVPPQAPQPIYRQITFVGDAVSPAISPDASFAAYVVGEQGLGKQQPKVMVRDLTGGQPIEVFRGPPAIGFLCWSPDGSKLALSGFSDENGWSVFVVPRLGGEPRHYGIGGSLLGWSPDGSRIVETYPPAPNQLYFLDVATGQGKPISLRGPFQWIAYIDWSATSGRLLFLTVGAERNTVWTIKPDGSNQTVAFSSDGGIGSPRWSPNGEAIYYIHGTEPPELWKIVLSAETGKPLGLLTVQKSRSPNRGRRG